MDMSETYVVTSDVGGKSMPTSMTVAPAEATMRPSALLALDAGAGVNAPLLADLLSSFLAHERCGVHLYRTVEGMTQDPEWAAKFREFGEQTKEHVRILESLVLQLGGDPMYVSPAARLTEALDSKLLETLLVSGSFDAATLEVACIEAVLQGERKCHANWEFLRQLADSLPGGSAASALRSAVDAVESQEDEHVRWAELAWQGALRSGLMTAA